MTNLLHWTRQLCIPTAPSLSAIPMTGPYNRSSMDFINKNTVILNRNNFPITVLIPQTAHLFHCNYYILYETTTLLVI